jgi:hypothetical protein
MRKESRLLYSESPTVFQKSLACTIGLNSAIFLQQLNFWLTIAEQEQAADQWFEGRWWVRNTYGDWVARHFPFWSIPTVKRIVTYLVDELHVVLSRPDPTRNAGKWYTIDFDVLDKLDVLPADIGRRLAIAEAAQDAGADIPEEPVDEPDPEPEEARILLPDRAVVEDSNRHKIAQHVRGHSQYHPVRSAQNRSTQNESTGRIKMSRPVESKCTDRSTQNESTSRLRLKELKNQSKNQIKTQKGSGRVLSAPASPPLIPPTAPVRRTGALVLQLSPQGDSRPIGHNQWAEPAWRNRVVEARAEYKHRREEET